MLNYITEFFGFSRLKLGQGKLEHRGAHRISLIILIVGGFLGLSPLSFPGALTLLIFAVTVYEFEKRIDQGLPLMQLAALLAVSQWLVGPWLCYNFDLLYGKYYMRVDSNVYFSYAIPGTAAFVLGLLSVGNSARQRGLLRRVDRSHFVTIGLLLVALGYASGIAAEFLPSGLGFVFFLLSQLRYVAALYFMFSGHSLRWPLVGMSVLPLFTGTAESGMFHDLLLWGGILLCYFLAIKRRNISTKISILVCGLLVVFTIQGVKRSYRDKVWKNEEGSMTAEIEEFWGSDQKTFSEETLTNAVVRLNQGWIIAAIMENVPQNEPYAHGDTLGEAVTAAVIPRMFVKDKATAGGQVSFRRFTGLPLADTTSMGISLLGEAYANVGPVGGIFLMLLFGGLLSLVYGSCLRWSVTHPMFYFWMPVIFCQAIKAETDLVTVLNQITKSSIVVFGLYWVICIKLFPVEKVMKRVRLRQPGSLSIGITSRQSEHTVKQSRKDLS